MADVLLDITNGVARLTLNRPDAANAVDLGLARGLLDAATELRARTDVRVVLLTGAGARFCGGGDVRDFAAAPDPSRVIREVTVVLHAAVSLLARLDAPIVAAVQGSAAGAGIGLVCLADLVLAAESTKFVLAYTGIGLTPDGSTSWWLPRLIGHRRAVELTLTNRPIGATEAAAIGLITRAVADDDLMAEAEALVAQLATGPTNAFGAAKRLLAASSTATLESHLAAESDAIVAAAKAPNGIEGLTSFVEKRRPAFS